MKKSKIKNQKSKIHIKNKIFLIVNTIVFLFILPLVSFAHEAEVPHEEPVPTISPVFLIGIVVVLAIGGFLVWKFVLHGPKSSLTTQSVLPDKTPPTQIQQVQAETPKTVQSSNQPENIEAKK